MSFTPPSGGVGSSVSIGEIEAATLVTESEAIASNDNDTTVPTSAAVKDYVDNGTATLANKTLTSPIITQITSDGSAKMATFGGGGTSWTDMTSGGAGAIIQGASTQTAGTFLGLTVRAGYATTAGNGGNLTMNGGYGSDTTGNGGAVTIAGGNAGSGGNANGGNVTLKGGVPQGSGTRGAVIIGGTAAATPLRFLEPSGSGSNYTEFVAQAQSGNVTYTLPAADGSSGQALTTNGSGTLSWAGGTIGYTLNASSATLTSPADSTTYYFGSVAFAPQTTEGYAKMYIPKAGTVTRIQLFINTGGTLATTEQSTVYFRLNGTTDTTISSVVQNDAATFFAGATVSIAVALDDYFEIKWDTPAWSTNPTNVRLSAVVYIE